MKKIPLLLLVFALAIILTVFAGCSDPDVYGARDSDPISISTEDSDLVSEVEDSAPVPDLNLDDDRDYIAILFVGNSFVFYGDVPGQLQTLAGTQDIEVRYIDISTGGATLRDSRDRAIQEMQGRIFDYVVLQDQSRRPLMDSRGFLDDVRIISDAARENGVIPVLFSPAVIDDEELQNSITAVYKQAADEMNCILIDAGSAWIYAYQTIPGLSPYKGGNQAFVAACVFMAILFDLNITYIPQDNRYTDDSTMALAQAAWDFVHTLS